MTDNLLLKKLLSEYDTHGKIIVGVDFDNTIFPLSREYDERCSSVRTILFNLLKIDAIDICLWTVADKYSLLYKRSIMKFYDIPPRYINMSPVVIHENSIKPYFNILLDDRAGLDQSLSTIQDFYNFIKQSKK